jgi:hypothetical protein
MSATIVPFPVQRHRRRHADQAAPIVRPHTYTALEKDAHKRRVYAFLNEQLERRGRSSRRHAKAALLPFKLEKMQMSRPPNSTSWKPGQSGNPKGRPKQQPNVDRAGLEAEYVASFAEHFAEHGLRAIVQVYQQDPARYLQFAGTLLPKEIQLQLTQKLPGGLSVADWGLLMEVKDAIERAMPDARERRPGDVLNYVLAALDAYAPPAEARLIESAKRI